MKTCPVCHAQVFDDMPVCFGCMHRFEEGDGPTAVPAASSLSAPPAAAPVSAAGAHPAGADWAVGVGAHPVAVVPAVQGGGGIAGAYENAAAGGEVPTAANVPLAFDAGVARFQLVVRLEPLPLRCEG